MDAEDFLKHLKQAADDGKLLQPKHDPNNLSTPETKYRSVLSYDLASGLEGWVKSEEYTVEEYENSNYPQTPLLYALTPTNPTFSVPASGVVAGDIVPSTPLDTIIAVSGSTQGWHLYGDNRARMDQDVCNGKLKNKRKLK